MPVVVAGLSELFIELVDTLGLLPVVVVGLSELLLERFDALACLRGLFAFALEAILEDLHEAGLVLGVVAGLTELLLEGVGALGRLSGVVMGLAQLVLEGIGALSLFSGVFAGLAQLVFERFDALGLFSGVVADLLELRLERLRLFGGLLPFLARGSELTLGFLQRLPRLVELLRQGAFALGGRGLFLLQAGLQRLGRVAGLLALPPGRRQLLADGLRRALLGAERPGHLGAQLVDLLLEGLVSVPCGLELASGRLGRGQRLFQADLQAALISLGGRELALELRDALLASSALVARLVEQPAQLVSLLFGAQDLLAPGLRLLPLGGGLLLGLLDPRQGLLLRLLELGVHLRLALTSLL